MSQDNYTEEEKRVLKLLEPWAESWSQHGLARKMVDELYADSTEVFTPIQRCYYVKKGQSKDHWREVEIEAEKLYRGRAMKIVTAIPRGNTVAIEVESTFYTLEGKALKGWFAAFLTFDEDGRIVRDHTYMPGPSPKDGDFPPGLREAMAKVAEDNR